MAGWLEILILMKTQSSAHTKTWTLTKGVLKRLTFHIEDGIRGTHSGNAYEWNLSQDYAKKPRRKRKCIACVQSIRVV